MTMLIIQLPCFNEAGQLPATTAALPRPGTGVSAQAWLVVGVMSTAANVGDDLITINRRPLENPQARQRQRMWVRR